MNDEIIKDKTHNFGVWVIHEYDTATLHELFFYLAQIKDYEIYTEMYEKRGDDEGIIRNGLYVFLRLYKLYDFYEEYRKEFDDRNIMTFKEAMKLVTRGVQCDRRINSIFRERLVFRNSFFDEIQTFYEYMYEAEHTFAPGD